MNKYYYDLHVHSCLSPCADDDNTPNNIAGMATLCGINIMAITDHNTCKNCPAFFEAAKRYGVVPVAGMELTTSEDVHIVCLFERLDDAMRFDEFVQTKRTLIKNREDIFGKQQILDSQDNVIGTESFLLSNATSISADNVYKIVKEHGGICYPAHIDRASNGIISVLGAIPPESEFIFFELNSKQNIINYSNKYGIHTKQFIISSDAHALTDIRDKENYFFLEDEPYSDDLIRHNLFRILSGGFE